MSDIPLDEVVYFDVICHDPATGAVSDADSTPSFAVYEESTDTDIGVGGSLTKRTSLTGNYRGSFTASSANGFELGKFYSVVASATVGSVAGKAVVKNFRVAAAETQTGYPKTDAQYVEGSDATDQINAAADVALADYDGPTNAELTSGLAGLNDPTAAAIADAVLDEVLSGHATAGTLGKAIADVETDVTSILADTDELQTDDIIGAISGLNDLSAAEVNAEILDVLTTDTFGEPTGVPGATVSLAVKIGTLYMALRNQIDVTASKMTFYDDSGSAEWEKDLSDDGTTYSESEANAI